MKRLILVFFLFSGLSAKSQCDTLTSATFTAITTNSVNVSFFVSGGNWSSFNVSLYDSATGFVAFNIPNLTTIFFTATGLTPNKTYILRVFTSLAFGGGCEPNGTLPKFRTLGNPLGYTPMLANGYSYKRISVDSTFHLPLQDTSLNRGLLRAGAIVQRTQDSSLYAWNGLKWDAYAKKAYVDTKPSYGDVRDIVSDSVMGKLNVSDTASMVATYRNRVNLITDSISAHNLRIGSNTTSLSLKENLSNKVNVITTPNSTDYPTTGAVNSFVANSIAGKADTSKVKADSVFFAKPTFLGSIYNVNSWASLSGLDNTTTASVSGGKILLSGGGGSTTPNTLAIASYSFLERWHETAKIRITSAASSTTYGIGLGVLSKGVTYQFSNYVKFDCSNGANAGKLLLYLNGTLVATSTTALSFSNNDYVVLDVDRSLDIYTISVTNATTSSSAINLSFSASVAATSYLLHNTGYFSIFNFGGTFTLDSLAVYSKEVVNGNLLCIGDSKTQGYSVSSFNNRFVTQLSYLYAPVIGSGGAGDGTQDVLNRISEIIALKPKQVLMCGIGRNELANGTSLATVQANYQSIVTQLQAAGITVIHTNCFYETTYNQATFSAWITSTYAGSIIDTYSPTKNTPNTVSSDGTHLTSLGDTVVFNKVVASGLIKYGTSIYSDIIKNGTGISGTTNAIPFYNSPTSLGASFLSVEQDTLVLKYQKMQPSTSGGYDNIYLRSKTANNSSGFSLMPNGSGTGFLTIYGEDEYVTSNWSRLLAWKSPTTSVFQISSERNGSGTLRDFQLNVAGRNGIIMRTYGRTEIGSINDTTFNYGLGLFTKSTATALDVRSGGFNGYGALRVGANVGSNSLSSNTRKAGIITSPTYSAAGTGTDVFGVIMDNDVSTNSINIGGLTDGLLNAATDVNIVLAANQSTLGGTTIAKFKNTGVMIQPAGGPYTVNTSSAFDVNATTQFSRPFPSMTIAQRNALTAATGGFIFNTVTGKPNWYNGSGWLIPVDSLAADGKYAPIASPKFTGTVTLPTTTTGTAGTDSVLVKTSTGVVRAVSPSFYATSSSAAFGGQASATLTAATTVTVTIGTTQANTNYEVNVTPTNATAATHNYYVTNKTTTTFDVVWVNNVTGTVTFDWILKP